MPIDAITEKILLEYGKKDALAKTLKKDLESLKKTVESIVEDYGSEKTKQSKEVIIADEEEVKVAFLLTKKETVIPAENMQELIEENKKVLFAMDLNLDITYPELITLAKEIVALETKEYKDVMKLILTKKSGMVLNGERFKKLVDEKHITDPEKYFETKESNALKVTYGKK